MNAGTPRLLLVDDDVSLAAMLREFLELQGFSVDVLHNAEDGLARIDADPPDLLVLDVMLPGMSGFEALKELRSRHELPVVMLTARGEESERILGLMGGADDYLPKPFNTRELIARIRAVLRRMEPEQRKEECFTLGPLTIDTAAREVRAADNGPVDVTAGEFDLLVCFLREKILYQLFQNHT